MRRPSGTVRKSGRWVACPVCRKRGYPSRRAARAAAKTLPTGTIERVYQCGGLWHLTSKPKAQGCGGDGE